MRRVARIGVAFAAVACAPRARPAPEVPAVPPPAAQASAPEPAPAAAPPRLRRAFVRPCTGFAEPIWTRPDAEFISCGARFSVDGMFVARASIDVVAVAGELVLEPDFGRGGFRVRGIDEPEGKGRRIETGHPERAAVSADGTRVVVVAPTSDGRELIVLDGPELQPRRRTVLDGAATTLALGVLEDGRVLWYGERGCTRRPCVDGTPACMQTRCDPPTGWIVDESGTAARWPELPSGLVAIELDTTGQWLATIDADGRVGVRSIEDPASVNALPHTAMHGEYERPTIAVGAGGRDVAVADATGVHAWSRTADGRVHARLTSGELDTTAMSWSRDGTTLLVAGTSALVGYQVKAPRPGPRPSLPISVPDGWQRAPEVDGVPTWTDDGRGEPWPASPGVVAWLRNDDGAEITVHLSDRAEFGRDELAPDAWARLVLDRIDPWIEPATEIELQHEDVAWRDDDGRSLQLHYTTVGGCEQYEVVHRVFEQGPWLWHVQLRQFAGEPWRDAWRTAVSQLPAVAPDTATGIW